MTQDKVSCDIVGGPIRHLPVMLNEVLEVLKPFPGQSIIDGTFGAGGYTSVILEAGANVLAIDRDPNAILDGKEMVHQSNGKLTLVQGEFCDLDALAREEGLDCVDGIVLDIGVSSMQLDEAGRGFSFQNDGPLDMRMAQTGVSAADVVNNAKQGDLTRIIGILGEEKKASRVSGAIVRAREKMPFSTTLQLAGVIEKEIGRRANDRIHPATRTFQALRIFVNRELEQLGMALLAGERILKSGGKMIVVTFHSLEDRMVKLFFRDRADQKTASRHLPQPAQRDQTFEIKGKGILKPGQAETEINARARSAKLRWAMRTEHEPRSDDMSLFGLPNLASLETFQMAGG